MKRTALMIVLVIVGIVAGLVLAGQYDEPVGNVKKANVVRVLLILDKDNVIKADCYWTLISQQGQVLRENQKTTCVKSFDAAYGWQDVKDFVKNELTDHRQAMKTQFKEDN